MEHKPIPSVLVEDKDHKEFEEWFGGLMWAEPYPHYADLARLAWLAARDSIRNQPNNNKEIEPDTRNQNLA